MRDDTHINLPLCYSRLSTDAPTMNSTTRAAMCEPRPSEDVGYLIYCPTEEELEDSCMEEDLEADLRWELGDDFMKADKRDQQIVAQSMYRDGNAYIRQSVMSTKELRSERASTGDESQHETNHKQLVEVTHILSRVGSEPQFDVPHRRSFLPETRSGEVQNVGFEGLYVAETGTNHMVGIPSSYHGGRNSQGGLGRDETSENTTRHIYHCSCNTCPPRYMTNTRTRREEKPHRCSFCDKEFAYECHLQRHVKTHTGEKPFKCSVCDKAFIQKNTLQNHMAIHTGEKRYQCSVCEKRFTHNSTLRSHMKIHTGVRPHGCLLCKKRFTDRKGLSRHMNSHTGEKPHECSICKKRFSQAPGLSIHMRRHTGDKPFECSNCQRRFYSNAHLVSHMRTHTGEKPFKCSVCNKEFSHTSSVYIHMRTHTGEKPHKCSICNKQFTQGCSLSRHIKNTHKGESLETTVK